jgi:hypothetical protein
MQGWWKQLLGAISSLPEGAESQLHSDLKPLDAVGTRLGERAARYAVDGTDSEVLDALAATKGGGAALHLKCCGPRIGSFHRSEREKFLKGLPSDSALLCLRLALVYEAACRQEARTLSVDWIEGCPEWLEIFLWEASDLKPNVFGGSRSVFVTHETVEAMLRLAGLSPDMALRAALFADPRGFFARNATDLFRQMDGLADVASRYPGVVREAFAAPEARQKVHALEFASSEKVNPAPHLKELVDLSVSAAKTVRAAGEQLLQLAPEAAVPLVRRKLTDGTTDERARAAELLFSLQHDGARAFLQEQLSSQQSERVRRVIENLLGQSPNREEAEPVAADETLAGEPLADPGPGRLTQVTRSALRGLCDEWYRKARILVERSRAQNPKWRVPDLEPVDDVTVDRIIARLGAWRVSPEDAGAIWTPTKDWRWRLDESDVRVFLELPELDLVHVVRFLAAIGVIDKGGRALRAAVGVDRYLRHYQAVRKERFGLRELAAAFRVSGLDPAAIGWSCLDAYWQWDSAFRWTPEATWPYFLENVELLEEAFELRASTSPEEDTPWRKPQRKSNALRVLESFPRVPARLKPKVWEIALGNAKSDRLSAQTCLGREPETTDRVIEALQDGKQDVRAVAADWLARLGAKEAVPALEASFAKEKHDISKAALMKALESLGVPVDRFLNRGGLVGEAEKGLRKGVPESLAWFPFDRLPELHWEDTGDVLPPTVITWFIVQAHKLGSPEPGALVRRYAQHVRSAEARALGRFVLEAWIAHDVELPTRQEIDAKAQQLAAQMVSFYQGKTLQEVVEIFVQSLMNQPKGSATGDKGVLAVAGAFADASAAPLVQQYLKKWYGFRAAQCRALLQMLSWIEHPVAIQIVLSTATRFRTAGIRKEAEKQSQLIAERKGWTVAELADRTIPTAGFDETGQLELDYGPRRFAARIMEDFSIGLSTPEGKAIATLPDARSDDSAELVTAAKASLSNAKKELKTVLKLQRERLYEAMCTERAWSFADWDVYLHRHPIVGRYCAKLVWTASAGERRLATFRPIGDGSLSDVDENDVKISADATIRAAHTCNTQEAEGQKWLEHFTAYEVEPLFPQFGRPLSRLMPEQAQEARVMDREGHMLKAFKLRARATKLGYGRGQAEDGGWFFVYRKHFMTLGLEAVIEFSGNGLPEDDRWVALRSLYFVRSSDGAQRFQTQEECVLGEVPAVLLSECWNDLRSIATEGPGFDPEWEKKVAP